MDWQADVIVVGSGVGGSMAACALGACWRSIGGAECGKHPAKDQTSGPDVQFCPVTCPITAWNA